MDYEKALEKIQNRIEYEFNEFFIRKTTNRTKKDIFCDCYEISFYMAFRDYLINLEVPMFVVELLKDCEAPISYIYERYLNSNVQLEYSFDEVTVWLEQIEKEKKYGEIL